MENTNVADLLTKVRSNVLPSNYVGTPKADSFAILCMLAAGLTDAELTLLLSRLVS